MLPLQDLIVIIRSPASQEARREVIRRTWGANLVAQGARVLFSVHAPARGIAGVEGDILEIPGRDSHQNLTPRMIDTFRWVLREGNWSHLLSMDDDCYVLVDRLIKLDWRSRDVLGHMNDRWYWSGGPGMFMSKRAVEFLDYHLGRDDCAIGALLTAAAPREFSMGHTPTFRPWREACWPTKDNATTIQHYVRDPFEMVDLFNLEAQWKSQ